MLKQQNNLSFIIADDDIDDQMLIIQAVRSLDITVQHTSVFNGAQLLELLLKQGVYRNNLQSNPDAIILDLNMPVLNGLGALRQIKGHALLKEIPVFVLHTLRMDNYSTQCRELNVAGLYVKPSTSQALGEILKEIYSICGGKPAGNDQV